MNPNPNGPIWPSGGAKAPLSSTSWDIIEFLPNQASYLKLLPSSTFNDEQPFFPFIKLQEGNSCVQMAEIWNIFTYEVNRVNNWTAGTITSKENIFHNLYAYNFLNGGSNANPTYALDGFKIIRDNGCPDWLTYNDPMLNIYPSLRAYVTPACARMLRVHGKLPSQRYKNNIQY